MNTGANNKTPTTPKDIPTRSKVFLEKYLNKLGTKFIEPI